ncbi:MAG: NADH-quinone oxidoreductase subunit NuoH [Anaerolineae bacterium]|jgi:NADH-quinone oxidoreductase subunit H|nr:NADH-quinone oxidoreductase subunit NuoH [Anaerolineae bacterium]
MPALVLGGLAVVILLGLITVTIIGGLIGMINSGGFNNPILCEDSQGCSVLHPILYSAIFTFIVVTGFAYTTLLERKFIAWFQQRSGPNRVGPWGLLQPAADGLKLIFKEDIMPADAYRTVYLISPMLKTVPALIVMAVIPLGPPITIPWFDGNWYRVPMGIADPGVGVLWLLAITSVGTYGIALAGWASNNKYAMLGGLRASAQMISYELSLGLAMIVPVMIAASMSVRDIIDAQSGLFLNWFVFQNPLAAGILIIALIAETNRAPFDLPEAEQELTAGFMTEYSGMKFAMFMMAEYLGMIAVSMIAAAMFFGGYGTGFGLENGAPIVGPLVTIGKVVLFLIGLVWIRATLPRLRYDRLMSFGWKVLLPLSLLAVCWTAVAVVIADAFGPTAYMIISGIAFAVVVFGGLAFLSRPNPATVEEEPDVESDPMITGERVGLGYMVLQAVGGLLAVPFVLFSGTINLLERLGQLAGDEPEASDNKPVAAEDRSPADPSGKIAQ